MHRSFVIVLSLAAAGAFAQATLRGTVIDGDDNSPMAGATVSITRLHHTTRTDDKGNWAFKNMAPGKYFVVIHAVGHKMFHDTLTTDSASTVVLAGEDIHQEDLVVTASADKPAATTHVEQENEIKGVDLDRVRGATVAQTLTVEPGVAMRSNGGAAARPVMRGLGDNRVTLLEDGLPSGDLSGSAPDHAVAIDPNAAERIDIVRGPGSLQYGNNALTGIINVIEDDIPTETQENSVRSITLDGATVNQVAGGSVSLAQSFGALAVKGSGSWHSGNNMSTPAGAIVNSDTKSANGTLGAAFVSDSFTVGASYRIFSEHYGIPVPTDTEPRSILNPLRQQVHVKTDWQIGSGTVRALSASGNITWYTHDERDRASSELLTSFALTSINATARVEHAPLINGGRGSIGATVSSQQYAVAGAEKLTPDGTFSGISGFVFEEAPVGPVEVQVGARVETDGMDIARDSALGFPSAQTHRWTGFVGSVGALYPLSEELTLQANLSQSFRAPGIEELAANNFHDPTRSFDIGSLAEADPGELQAEHGVGGDLTLQFHLSRLHGEATVYDNRIANFIYRAFRGDSIQGVPVYEYRQADANLIGGEFKAEYDLGGGWFATALADIVRGKRTTDNSNLPQMPPPRIALGVRYSGDVFWYGAEVRGALRQTDVAPEEIAFSGNLADAQTAGSALLNLDGGIRLIAGNTIHTISLKVDNALDQAYRDHLSVSKWFALEPGRNIALRYQMLF